MTYRIVIGVVIIILGTAVTWLAQGRLENQPSSRTEEKPALMQSSRKVSTDQNPPPSDIRPQDAADRRPVGQSLFASNPRRSGCSVRTVEVPSERGGKTTIEVSGCAARTASIPRGAHGHFEANALVDGRRMGFIVDTGASVIVLRRQEASRLGIYPAQRDYTAKVSTANGTRFAAPIALGRVDVGGITVRYVAALVLPDGALPQNLLGMSFLSRVHWQYQGGRLELEQ